MPTFSQIKWVLHTKTVGIAGAGGLGSNCAASLVRSGVGKLIIADYDVVTEENLNRQFYFKKQTGCKKVEALRDNLLRINPKCLLQMHDTKVDEGNISLLFSVCDVVVEAFDDAGQKRMLIEYMLTYLPHIPLVAASGMAGWGRSHLIKVVKSGNLYVCGDGVTEIAPDNPPIAPRVNVVANLQADTVLDILLKESF